MGTCLSFMDLLDEVFSGSPLNLEGKVVCPGINWSQVLQLGNGLQHGFARFFDFTTGLSEGASNILPRLNPETFQSLSSCSGDDHLRYSGLVKLFHAKMEYAQLQSAVLTKSALLQAQMQGANLTLADVSGSELFETNLRGANCESANFTGSAIYGADLRDANFRYAKLVLCNCWYSFFEGADFRGADLSRSILQSSFSGAIYDSSTKWPEDFDPKKKGLILYKGP